RQVLLEQLGAAIPMMVSNCRSNPDRLYGDYLPEPIKVLMVGLAEQAEGSE
ncbi:energy transducer TonB, partial [Pseudomonas syringae pv. syringae FF5]